jgi:cell division protein FtsQ
VVIDISGPETGESFVEKKEVMNLLTANGTNKLQGRALKTFKLQQLETLLKKNVWVRKAQLYFDSKNVLHVKIEERVPLARVFTSSGASFYLDSNLKRLPLSDQIVLKLPVFTGFPTDKKILKKSDSILLQQIKEMSEFLLADAFWMAQIAQVDISVRKEFELAPTVGSHVIVFGKGDDIEKKFRKLRVFYEQVAAKAGFDKYSEVNIQYNGQVIGVKKEKQRTQVKPEGIIIQNNDNN